MTRLQKLLAAAGLGSRRSIEQWIRDGRITVSGRVAQLGDRAGSEDEILLDGRKLDLEAVRHPSRELLLYHKPWIHRPFMLTLRGVSTGLSMVDVKESRKVTRASIQQRFQV
jgi:hypothetical protein